MWRVHLGTPPQKREEVRGVGKTGEGGSKKKKKKVGREVDEWLTVPTGFPPSGVKFNSMIN